MFLLCFFLSLFCCVWGLFYSVDFSYYLDRCGLGFSDGGILFDGVSSFCLLMLLFCGSAALFFCCHYFSGDRMSGIRLCWMLFSFLVVMCFLVCSYGMLVTLFFWEYLGLVSFFLILFYCNLDSLRATVVTLFASRFGDVCLFGLVVYGSLCWGFSILSFFFILLVVLTKSACFPFISWLLEAMRAPTPVSSLVHSSTLVAAGIWFLFRYGGGQVLVNPVLEFVFFVLSLSTVLVTSLCSVVFLDLKKVVALSTCNNISWCIIFFLFGDVFLGLSQLLGHGVAKCYLFISLGDLMSGSSSSQDVRGVFCCSYWGGFSVILQSVLIVSLSGLPFMGIFFSKHGLLCELLWSCSIFCYFLLFFSFFLSCVYSFRLLGLVFGFKSLGVCSVSCFFLVLFLLSLLSGVLNFLFIQGAEDCLFLGVSSSLSLLFFQILGAFLGVYLYFRFTGYRVSLFGFFSGGLDGLIGVFYFIYDCLSSFFLFLLYRWEVWFLVRFSSCFTLGGSVGFLFFSLKFLVLSGVFFLLICLILY